MASKRTTPEEGNDKRDSQAHGKRKVDYSEQPNTLYLASGSSNSRNDMVLSLLEPSLRKVLQETLQPMIEGTILSTLQRYQSPCCGLALNRQNIGTSGGRSLQLCFMNRIRPNIFTNNKIMAEDGSLLQIALCEFDATSQQRKVKEDVSSLRIQIFVLNGDFGSNGSEDFTAEDFKANILSPREGKPPLLGRDTFVTIKNGFGYLDNSFFTDNSKWTKSGLFRIGLKVDESTSNGADIMEGRSEPVRVRDKRGKAYEKRDRPSLNDEVWRLHTIAKTGKIRMQLSLEGIKTVKDMLRWFTIDKASLQRCIGKIAEKQWHKLIEHAKACEIDNHERYIYFAAEAEQSVCLVFNCIYEVVEVSFNGQNFCSLDCLNSEQERLVEIVKKQAYSNLKDLKPYEPTPHSLVTLANINFPITQQDPFTDNLTGELFSLNAGQQQQHEETWPNLYQPSTSTTSYFDEAAVSDQACSSQLQDHHQLEGWPSNIGYNEWMQNFEFSTSCFNLTPPTTTNLWEQVDDSDLYTHVYGTESSKPAHTSTKEKARAIWRKFRNVRNFLKWFAELAVQKKTKVYHYCQD